MLVDENWLQGWCPTCRRYRELRLYGNEYQCEKCDWPIIRILEPRFHTPRGQWKLRKSMEEPLP